MKELIKKFKKGRRKSGHFWFVGLKINKERDISVNKDLYTEQIEEVRFDVKDTDKLD